jgi:phytoene desaturase
VLERCPVHGGRAGRHDAHGYRIDIGPTVLTMPDIVEEALAAVGESLEAPLPLVRLEPTYRAHFADGSVWDAETLSEGR